MRALRPVPVAILALVTGSWAIGCGRLGFGADAPLLDGGVLDAAARDAGDAGERGDAAPPDAEPADAEARDAGVVSGCDGSLAPNRLTPASLALQRGSVAARGTSLAAVWVGPASAGGPDEVVFAVYDTGGATLVDPVTLRADGAAQWPHVVDTGLAWAIAWTGSDENAWLATVDRAGTVIEPAQPLGPALYVAAGEDAGPDGVVVGADVLWVWNDGLTGTRSLRAQRTTAAGALVGGAEIVATDEQALGVRVDAVPGGAIVAWDSADIPAMPGTAPVRLQGLGPDGAPTAASATIEVAGEQYGSARPVWTGDALRVLYARYGGAQPRSLRSAPFDAALSSLGPPEILSTEASGLHFDADGAPIPGGALIVWQSNAGSLLHVLARTVDAAGAPTGPEIPVAPSASPQLNATALRVDGRPAVGWYEGGSLFWAFLACR